MDGTVKPNKCDGFVLDANESQHKICQMESFQKQA